MNAVETENLRKEFVLKQGLFRKTTRLVAAVEGISLAVPAGQSVAFIGPNGAGKSTTIKMLTGILKPTSGRASVLGLNPWKERNKLVREIGAVFGQRSQLWLHLPPADSFDLLAEIYGLAKQDYKRRRDMLVERFELGRFLHSPVRKLSLGERMRAEIAASLLHRPRLLLLDEPTIGVDVVARQQLRQLVCEWNKQEGVTVFLTSHDTGDIESVADRVIVINHGVIVLDDSLGALSSRASGSAAQEGQSQLEALIAHLFTSHNHTQNQAQGQGQDQGRGQDQDQAPGQAEGQTENLITFSSNSSDLCLDAG
jgi:ABC-2 type transport system ATP-binding protein